MEHVRIVLIEISGLKFLGLFPEFVNPLIFCFSLVAYLEDANESRESEFDDDYVL